ncbi:hypothetical protein BC826DRAFT_485534 [Russula brevipes]|nr:hypothetical protein BC826DRAFT_485534 [Russula brevipes]
MDPSCSRYDIPFSLLLSPILIDSTAVLVSLSYPPSRSRRVSFSPPSFRTSHPACASLLISHPLVSTSVFRLFHRAATRGKSSFTPRRAREAASGSSNEVSRVTSYGDIQDGFPADHVAEEDPGSYDDDFDVALAPRKSKSKSRARIGFDDEPEDGGEEGYVEAPPIVKLPASYRLRNAGEPAFSIVPSPSKRVSTPSRTSRGLGLLSSIRVRSGPAKSFPPPALNDEEQGEAKPPTYKLTQIASDESPCPGGQFQKDDPATPSKFKPRLKPQVSPALVPAPASHGDRLLITIRHLPTEKDNKFKVKATHAAGRVLTIACVAFELNASGYVCLLTWSFGVWSLSSEGWNFPFITTTLVRR